MHKTIKKGLLIALTILISVGVSIAQEWILDFDKAKEIATAQNKPIIVVFQGSDWCAPCIKLDREIWSTEAFKTYAAEHYVMLQVDFPRKRNALPKAQVEANAKMAERYNKSGVFPLVVVLDRDGKVLGETSYKKIAPEAYIKELDGFTMSTKSPGSGFIPLKRTLKLMGSRFEITVVAENEQFADSYIDEAVAEIVRIEKLISSWDKNSQTSAINNMAGIKPVSVDLELILLLERAIKLSQLTDGAFDVTYASMDNVWSYDGSMKEMPSAETIEHSIEKVGYQDLIIDRTAGTVFLKKPGMKIGFGAIGKGYAADKAKALLESKGVISGIINASGDMNTWGKQVNGEDWKVAITNPLNKDKAFALLPLNDAAVVTSGNYEKFVEFEGKRYSHIIDPRTGYPASGLISVTVFAPSAELADALATSVFVMGKETGLDRINQLPGIECILIDDLGKITYSSNIKLDAL